MSTKTRSREATKKAQQPNVLLLGIGAGVFVLIALVAIVLLGRGSGSGVSSEIMAEIPRGRLSDGGFVLGNPDAPITIVEFADFLCPACQQYKPTIDRIIQEYVATGQARLEYRTLITAGGDATRLGVQLAECADDQRPGAFWDAYEILYAMAIERSLQLRNAGEIFAERMGMNYGQLVACSARANQLVADERLARQLGANSTPSIFVRYGNGMPVNPPYGRTFDGLSRAIQEAQ